MTIKELARHGYSFRGSSAMVGGEWCCSLEMPSRVAPALFFDSIMAEAFEKARRAAIADFVERRLS